MDLKKGWPMATIAPVIPLDEHRVPRAPQPAPSEEASYLSLIFEMGKGHGALGEREWWFEALGPWAEEMWAAAHPAASRPPS